MPYYECQDCEQIYYSANNEQQSPCDKCNGKLIKKEVNSNGTR